MTGGRLPYLLRTRRGRSLECGVYWDFAEWWWGCAVIVW